MPQPLPALQRHPRATLALAALAMLGGYAWLIPWHARAGGAPLPDWTLALDLLVVLPLLAWWLHHEPRPRRAPGRLRCTGMGRANLRLCLQPGTRLATLTGEREVHEVLRGVDEPERLLRALNEPGVPTA